MMDPATVSCTIKVIEFPDGKSLARQLYAYEDERQLCHDCGVATGGIHHPGCDMERCHRCGIQLISCECRDDDDEK